MARTFNIDIAASPSSLLERVRITASENGLKLLGNESSGRFSHKMLEGEYRVIGRRVMVTVTHKPRLVPWSVLEDRLKALFALGLVEGLLAGIHAIAGIRTIAETPLTFATTKEDKVCASSPCAFGIVPPCAVARTSG